MSKKINPSIALVAIGSEVVTGKTLDTNTQHMTQLLSAAGFSVSSIHAVRDHADEMKMLFDFLFQSHNVIVTTGGLGPTFDDITTRTLADFFGRDMVYNKHAHDLLKVFFTRVKRPSRKEQAFYPEGVSLFKNHSGVVPGIVLGDERGVVIAVPGVPHEMSDMMIHEVIPYLKAHYAFQRIETLVVKTAGGGETIVEQKVKQVVDEYQSDEVDFGIYPNIGEVQIRITVSGKTKKQVRELLNEVNARIDAEIGEMVWGYDDDTLSGVLVSCLKKKKQTVALAESCTGGLIGKMITDVAGASDVFLGGVVAYANSAKEALLDIPSDMIEKHGAVSRDVARALARNVRKRFGADYGLAVTGIAGPGGGTKEKPVGRVYGAIASSERTRVFEWQFHGSRDIIRERTKKTILFELYKQLL